MYYIYWPVLELYMIKCTSPNLVKLFIYLALIACMELHKCVHAGLTEIQK